MSSINHSELFEQYYQSEYDFNTTSLNTEDIRAIKEIAREKRVDYGLAPLGTGIFELIRKQNSDIRFEPVSFESDNIDGMLYIPRTGKERAYIILNSNKPLVNQIFTSAHEFYHYIKDYQLFKEKPYICDFSMLKDVNEKKACRFAAEILLPEEALFREFKDFNPRNFNQTAVFIMLMTIRYQMPLKAIIYRLAEEKLIDSIDEYIENYSFIKRLLEEIRIYSKQVDYLYQTKNPFILPYSKTYEDMENAFISGYATREEILKDAETLSLDLDLVHEKLRVYESDEHTEPEDNEDELFAIINKKLR